MKRVYCSLWSKGCIVCLKIQKYSKGNVCQVSNVTTLGDRDRPCAEIMKSLIYQLM